MAYPKMEGEFEAIVTLGRKEWKMVLRRVKKFSVMGLLAAINGFMTLAFYQDVQAMPAFARRYQTSCVTCHATYPVLNAVGDAFRLDGFRFRDDEKYLKKEPVELGDETYKKLWPDAMWPSHIPDTSGVSFAARMFAEVDIGHVSDERVSDVTFVLPHETELSWAGALGEHMAAYGDMIFVQEDYGTQEMYSWLMAKAWIELSDLVGPENAINLRVGTVGMHTIGLYTAKSEQRLGIQGLESNGWSVPWVEPYLSDTLIDFWGNTFVMQPQLGIELSGFGERWLYYAGVVNGNIEFPEGGRPELIDKGKVHFVGAGKNLGTKDYYGGFAYKIGGLGFNGAGAKGDNPLEQNTEFWRDDSITFSAFGYRGTAEIMVDQYDDPAQTGPDDPHTRTTSDDEFWRLAIGAKVKYKDLVVNTGYQWGHDDNPYGVLWDDSLDVETWFVEAAYFVYPWLIPYVRYEQVNFEGMPQTEPTDDIHIQARQDLEVFTIGFKAHLVANVHLSAEYQDYIDPSFTCMTDEVLFIQLMFAF
jgi:hypothetical protein